MGKSGIHAIGDDVEMTGNFVVKQAPLLGDLGVSHWCGLEGQEDLS